MHRVDDAGELDKEPITGGLDDAAAMLPDPGIGDLAPPHPQRGQRSFLVLAHEAAIAGDIGCQYRRQMARGARSSPWVHPDYVTARGALATAPPVRWFAPELRAVRQSRWVWGNLARPARWPPS